MIRKSQATRDHTRIKNLTLISLSRFLMKHVPLTSNRIFRKNLANVFVWPLDGTHVFCINSSRSKYRVLDPF